MAVEVAHGDDSRLGLTGSHGSLSAACRRREFATLRTAKGVQEAKRRPGRVMTGNFGQMVMRAGTMKRWLDGPE